MNITAASTPPRVATLIILTAASVLSLNMFLPSLNNMAAEFGVTYEVINISVAGYLAVTGVLQLIIGPCSDRFGRRPVLLTGAVIFMIASVGCALATDVRVFLAMRILQGAIISGAALSRAVVRDMLPPKDAAGLLATIGTIMAIAPMIGPTVGGLLDTHFGWRASFWLYGAIGLLLCVLIWVDLGETNEHKSDTFKQQFATYPELLSSKRFWAYVICLSFSLAGFYAFLAGAPLVASLLLDLPTSKLGFYMGSTTAGFFVGSFVSRKMIKHYSMNAMIIIGRLVAIAGLSVALVLILAGYVNTYTIFGGSIFLGVGNGISMPSNNVAVMNVRANLAGSASGLSGALVVALGAVLSVLITAILTPENAAVAFVLFLLAAKFISLFAALWARKLEHALT